MSHSNLNSTTENKPKLLDQVRFALQTKHYSIRTEQSYLSWIKRFILFHRKRHPREEAKAVLSQLSGVKWIMAMFLYGAGLRLMECLRLRVKDIDFEYNQVIVRDGKGEKDRETMLPQIVNKPMQKHLAQVKKLHEKDLKDGYGMVYLPYALGRKSGLCSL